MELDLEEKHERKDIQMKAIVYEKFGPPEVLQLKEVDKPTPSGLWDMFSIYSLPITA
jgi:hypothetical protein